MPDVTPPDAEARLRIAEDLESTLFVDAGAGSGKTTALVTRVLALVGSGTAELAHIAAITFTEKAATELRDRLRRELEKATDGTPDSETAGRYRLALDQLDSAAIGTLHSFAQRILSEHPIEAGLPPKVDVVDEVSSDVAFDRRWSLFRDLVLADPAYERTVLLLTASGVRFEALRTIALTFNDNWDLVDDRVPASCPEPPPVQTLLDPLLSDLLKLCAEPCSDPADKLRGFCDHIAAYVERLQAIDDELDLLEALDPKSPQKPPSFKPGGVGRQVSWQADLKEFRAQVRDAGERLEQVRATVANACVARLGSALRAFTLEAAEERRRAGQLEFHDLLVRARSLLRDQEHGPFVRGRLHEKYRRLLLDEFQDTDPIQVELAVLIAADGSAGPAADDAGGGWGALDVTPGQLFFVGDPKQSIYRFRRADISTFLAASERFGRSIDGDVELSANFRTVAPVIDWVNATFGELIDEADDDDLPVPSQPAYVALQPVRPAPPAGPPVAVVGAQPDPRDTSADGLRELEAADVAASVARAVREGWSVDDGEDGWRPARFGDITVLVPARTSLPFLEDALDQLGIPYRAESSSLVYASRAVRDLLMVLRSLADPTNQLHLVSALRTPLFGCGDDDLFRFRIGGRGRWSYLADQPDTVPDEDPVRAGLDYLRSLYELRAWMAPSEILDRIARDRRAMDLGVVEGRPRDVWRRIRFVIDQARAWSEATGGNLRQYLSWVEMQTAEGARVAEAILPETDDDAVRIMTIHAAKGLEFPITIVSGMSTIPRGRRAAADVVFPPTGQVGYRVGTHAKTAEYEAWAPIDEQMGYHERIRLLYVACTRARDHLVVSLHRKERASDPEPEKRTNAELLFDGMGALLEELPDLGEGAERIDAPLVVAPTPPMPYDDWKAEREEALRRASRPTTVSATSLTDEGEPDVEEEPEDPGLQKRPRDLDLPPWLKGRYGTAVGRAVHGVLQTIDLATGAGVEDAVAAQCEAEAILDRAEDVRTLVEFALESPSVKAAASAPHWRELYVCVPLGDRQLEGYVDLLYEGPEGLVVVDYKTAATSDPEDLAARVEGYRAQGLSYALAVRTATDRPVTGVMFLFLTPSGAVEISLPVAEGLEHQVSALVQG